MKMKKTVIGICLMFFFYGTSVYAAPTSEAGQSDTEQSEYIKNQTEEAILDKIDFSEVDESLSKLLPVKKVQFKDIIELLISGDWENTGSMVLQFLKDQISYEFRTNKQNLIHIVLIAIVAAVFSNFSNVVQNRQISETGFYILYVLLITLCLNTFRIAMSGIEQNLENILNFMSIFCPGYFLVMAISVGSSSAVWFYNLVLLLIFLSEIIFLHFLMPVIHIYIMVQIMNHLFLEDVLGKLAVLLKKFINWFLKTVLGIVIGINIIQGLIGPSADLLKRSSITKTLESLPGLGNVFGSAADVILGTAVLLKNGIGMAGAIILFLICAVPIIQMVILVFFYQLAAAMVQPVSDKRITECISSVGEGYELMLKVLVTTMLLFLLTIAIASASTT